jgi:DNA-binding transcriptional LysR family regulator
VLRAFQKRSPGVRVVLHDHSSPEMLAGLREGRLQAALMMQPSGPAGRGVIFEQLRSYPIVIAVPPEHPFSRRRAVSVAAVLEEPLVGYSRQDYPDYHQFLARRVGVAVKKLQFAEECNSGMSLIAAVTSGKGICIIAESLAAMAGNRLKFIPLIPATLPAVVGIAYRAAGLTQRLSVFIKTAKATCR